jgi:TRAP-type transport system periplasmic protein
MLKRALLVLLVGIGITVAHGAAAQTIELKMSHFVAPTHGWTTDFMRAWADEVSRKAGGKVKV